MVKFGASKNLFIEIYSQDVSFFKQDTVAQNLLAQTVVAVRVPFVYYALCQH